MPKFVPSTPGLQIGTRSQDVPTLKEFLKRFGYYSSSAPAHVTGADRDLFGRKRSRGCGELRSQLGVALWIPAHR
jgi:hypothetical protein